MLIQTTSLLPRPRSESCFSTMENDQEVGHRSTPKKEMAMTMLNLPINPLKKKLHFHTTHVHHGHHHKSEMVLSPSKHVPSSASPSEVEHHQKSSPFLSLKTPPAVLTQPSASLYPSATKKCVKKTTSVTTPSNPPGTLPGYYPLHSHTQSRHAHVPHHSSGTPSTSTMSPPSVSGGHSSHHRSGGGHEK